MNATNTKQALSIGWASRDVSTDRAPCTSPGSSTSANLAGRAATRSRPRRWPSRTARTALIFVSADIVEHPAPTWSTRVRARVAER
jgi:hypothetical protein